MEKILFLYEEGQPSTMERRHLICFTKKLLFGSMFTYLFFFFMMMGFFGYGIIFVYPVALLSFLFELLGFDTS